MSSYSQAIGVARWSRQAGSQVRVSSLAAVLIPSFSAAIFMVTLAHVLLISAGTRTLFHDSDAGWHIRAGEAILSTFTVPRADPFSFTNPGREWFAWEWVSDVLLGAAHRLAGPAGVALLAALVIAVTAWAASRLALSLGGNLFFTAIAAVLLLGTTSIHWLARPHLFSWLIALFFLAVTEHQRRSPSRTLYWLPAISCCWANLHGSFLLGSGILFVYAAGEWLSALGANPSRDRKGAVNPLRNRLRTLRLPPSATRFALAAVASLAATFINPYGWKLHAHIFLYLRNTYIMDHIAEFRSFSFHAPGAIFVELFLAVAVLGTLAMAGQRAYGPALLGVILLHFSLYSARYLPVAAVLLLPLSIAALTRELNRIPSLRSFLDYSERLRAIDGKVCGAVPVVLALIVSVAALAPLARAGQIGFDPATFPVRAADYLEQRGVTTGVFAKDQWGGYLIYRFDGRMKVFLDGRSDYYGQRFLEAQAQVMGVKPGWDAALRQFDVQFVLAPSDHALAAVLALSPEWKHVYADSTATIFEKVDK